jgi:hypothetical protein
MLIVSLMLSLLMLLTANLLAWAGLQGHRRVAGLVGMLLLGPLVLLSLVFPAVLIQVGLLAGVRIDGSTPGVDESRDAAGAAIA